MNNITITFSYNKHTASSRSDHGIADSSEASFDDKRSDIGCNSTFFGVIPTIFSISVAEVLSKINKRKLIWIEINLLRKHKMRDSKYTQIMINCGGVFIF